MREYYCPYCGERSLREYHKLHQRSSLYRRCPACGKTLYQESPSGQIWNILPATAAALLLVAAGLTPWKWLAVLAVVLLLSSVFLGDFLRAKRSRFVRAPEDLREIRWHRARLTAADGRNLEKLLLTTSCFRLRAELSDEARELAVLVESSAIAADGAVRLGFIHDTKREDFSGVAFQLEDGLGSACTGVFL